MTWNSKLEKMLVDLWESGISTSAIAEKMGITKGAVCGKVRRMDLKMRRPQNGHLVIRRRWRK